MALAPPGIASLSQLAANNSHIIIPWTKTAVQLGGGFKSWNVKDGDPFAVPAAFDSKSLQRTVIQYTDDDGFRGSSHRTSSTSSMEKAEHLSVSAGISVDCGFLGASATCNYDKAVLEDQNTTKHSIRESVRSGTIYMASTPDLGPEAQRILRCPAELKDIAIERFKRRFGDYYVAGLRLGGDSSVFVSVDEASKSSAETFKVKVNIRVLFWSTSIEHSHEERAASQSLSFQFAAFDSLTQTHETLSNGEPFEQVRELVKVYTDLGGSLNQRIADLRDKLGLEKDKILNPSDIASICQSGLVVEVILQPFIFQRDFVAHSKRRDPIF
ncbi:hypothetical protein PFICI_06500 [Pestalotiopsis fici W106-1]|uniref:MACPF domain-containing protein n=1 Tax=Pestalotiopsis fici (strain W106-1 / CGMCC3.15140) TaxID=1229662 RepID=W3X5T6_PESFW|nr:uncharacterized protein PFICI_06500 [Pestalotiopsis fici W106-1]ETS81498.1 hypothetical protein PFICI_06500 [Pestalotiopsis fici W106-1]